ncbi:MAG: penicillin acylase family protein [Saprospiraceae bacterium]|nr:penicillin acylase family protein [Saprospiraceae bacterium]
MTQKILYFSSFLFTVILVLFLNGNIQLLQNPIPPFGKFLNPFGGIWTSNTKNEKVDLTLDMYGLKEKVEIVYDDRRVAHIFASNIEDALFAQGYAEAQNRLFQMEFLALAAAGELSSVMGARTLEIDKEKRRRGMKFAAENATKGWEQFKDFNAAYRYVDGVNAYIKSLKPSDYPIEFKLFDIKPQEWSALKCALVFKQMSLTLAGRNSDIKNTNLLQALGTDDFKMLYPEKQSVENPIIPLEKPYSLDTLYGQKQDSGAFYNKKILNVYYEKKEKGIGSNSWAVGGSKTASGRPIFCNDPHLSLGLPSIWFELHIHTPEFNAYGVSFPGMPGIMIGFNDYIAWGETNVGHDVEDLFHIQWTNKERTKYMLDGKETEVDFRIEEIKVKGGKTLIDTVKYTYWGPVYHTSEDGQHDLAMRWLCHDVPHVDEYNVFINAMKCKNYNDYLQATEGYIAPAQNFGFASVQGDIALRVNGRLPAKYDQDGRFVENGNNTKNNWQGWIPRKQNPQIINPKRGFISSANQVSADKSYPYYYTGRFERYRNRSVNDKLTAMTSVDVDDMKKMQQDAFSHKAADYLNHIRSLNLGSDFNGDEKKWFDIITNWDNHYSVAQEGPVMFDLFYKKLADNTWDEIEALRTEMNVEYPDDWRLLELIINDPKNKYFDYTGTKNIENARDIIIKSFKESFADMEKRKKEGKGTNWGSYKPLHIYHLTRVPAFSSMDISAPGCPDAINATGNSFGPSWRMVVSMEDQIKAYGVYPGGQSGNPTSKYYKNMIESWVKGEYYVLNKSTDKEAIRTKSTQSITLNPKK